MSKINIALVGNPNSGKTTLFNALTGANQYVGNWPGVTVEKKEGLLKHHKNVLIQDLPGIYSLSPYSLEEVVSRNYLITDHPALIINLVDAANLERNLYLTTQLCELGVPVIVALNMMDIVEKRGDRIDVAALSQTLGCRVIPISALKGTGVRDLVDCVETVMAAKTPALPHIVQFPPEIETALEQISGVIAGKCPADQQRWFAAKTFEYDRKVMHQLALSREQQKQIDGIIQRVVQEQDDESDSILINARYNYVTDLVAKTVQKATPNALYGSAKLDRILTHKWLGFPIFAVIMWAVYYISIQTVGAWGTDWANDVLFGELVPAWVEAGLTAIDCAPWLQQLVLDGVIGGVGAVLGFLPQLLVLFLCLGILEDCGYMARVAFIMDRIFRKFGLSGKSFIPMLVSMGCSVPGIMATRTIESEKDRRMTVMTTSFIPCGAKTPIIALIAGAFFPHNSWVAPGAYFIGMAAIILSGLILKKTRPFLGKPTPFLMELPLYHVPAWRYIMLNAWDRCKAFVQKAGTVIFISSIIIWFLSNYNVKMQAVEQQDSMLVAVGKSIAPVFEPIGWGEWQATVATLTGLVAKENVVSTFGVLYANNSHGAGMPEQVNAESVPVEDRDFQESMQDAFQENAQTEVAATEEQEVGEPDDEEAEIHHTGALLAQAKTFTFLSAFSFMVFNLLCAPCIAAMGAIRREMNNAKWTLFAIGYMCVAAYVAAYLIYQLGVWVYAQEPFGAHQGIALALLAGLAYLIFRKKPQSIIQKEQ